jgi:hypothetical protein
MQRMRWRGLEKIGTASPPFGYRVSAAGKQSSAQSSRSLRVFLHLCARIDSGAAVRSIAELVTSLLADL